MSPRLQRIFFFALLGICLLMSGILLHLRERAHERLLNERNNIPAFAQGAEEQPVDLILANDVDGSLTPQKHQIALPADPGTRARLILNILLAGYTDMRSTHHLPVGDGVEEVFLLPVPGAKGDDAPLLAVVNLKKHFVETHPSGLETETLTVLSICSTLRASNPRIAQVRFLVDGQAHETLAGHIDLERTYLTSDSGTEQP
jgi:hypothetical protein